jgi:predicted  nucleic acid-binding Zn-ribbon protein
LAAEAAQRERELKEAAARDRKAVEDAAMRERAKLRQDLADLRSRLEQEQKERSKFEQEARLLRTNTEKLKKQISDNQLELSSKCSSLTAYFLSLLELRIRSRDCGE